MGGRKMRKFYEVKENLKKSNLPTKLPVRKTSRSAGYDFFSKIDADVKPGEIIKIWTDVKLELNPDEFMMADIRSSMGGTWYSLTIIGIIDADYFSNPKNDGNIGFFLKNISEETQHINIGDSIGQGIITKYLTVDDDNATGERTGGFGSTGK